MENNNWEKELSKLALEAEVHPPDEIWNTIEKKLGKSGRYKKPLPGIFLGGITIIILLLTLTLKDSVLGSKSITSAKGNPLSESPDHSEAPGKLVTPNPRYSDLESDFPLQLSEKPDFIESIDNFSIRNNAVFNGKRKNTSPGSSGKSNDTGGISGPAHIKDISGGKNSESNLSTTRINIEDIQNKNHSGRKDIRPLDVPRFEGNISTLTATTGPAKSLARLKGKNFRPVYNDELLDFSPIDCPNFQAKKRLLLYTDVELGIGYSIRNLSPKNMEASEYAGMRRSSEEVWYNAGGAVHLGIIWSNISIDIGMEYFQLNEVFRGHRENEKRITINILEDDMGQIIGRDTIIETGTREIVARNSYKQYLLPVRIGYLQSKGNFTLGAHIGGSYTFSNHIEGVIFDTNGTYYGIGSDNNAYFHKEGYWKIITGLYVGYKSGKNTELFLRPQLSLDQRSMDNINASASQKYNNIQLFGGIRYFIH